MSAPVEIRRIRPEDWPELKALRLEALADTPIGFLETLDAARELPDEAWQMRAARGAQDGDPFRDSLQVMAWDGGRAVGTCASFLRDGAAWLAAVYVSPAYRARGLLGELVDECATWARGRSRGVLRLGVHEDNGRARAAYAKLGFVETGERQPYDLDRSREELLLERPL